MASALWRKGCLRGTGGAAVLSNPRKEAASDVLISLFSTDSLRSRSATCRVWSQVPGGQSGLLRRGAHSLPLRTDKHRQALEEHGPQGRALSEDSSFNTASPGGIIPLCQGN